MKNANYRLAGQMLLLLGVLSLGVDVANADASPSSEILLPAVSLHLSKDLSIGMSYTESAFHAGMAQGRDGESSISKVAKAYLDYTFLSHRTENFHQNLQGRFEIANKSDSPLGDSARFRVDNTAVGAYNNMYLHDIADYRANSGFLASLMDGGNAVAVDGVGVTLAVESRLLLGPRLLGRRIRIGRQVVECLERLFRVFLVLVNR